MVSPAQRRTWVRWVREAFAVSERTACDAGGVARSSVRYQSLAAPQETLRELVQTGVAYGYLRRGAAPPVARMIPGAANENWAMDFIHDQLADGTSFRVLSMVDLHTRD